VKNPLSYIKYGVGQQHRNGKPRDVRWNHHHNPSGVYVKPGRDKLQRHIHEKGNQQNPRNAKKHTEETSHRILGGNLD
jgi:hypothetical protein